MSKSKMIIFNDESKQWAIDFISGLESSRRWTIEIELEKNQRTLNQNALLHKWLGIIAEAIGESPAETKEIYRQEFLLPVIVERGGKTYEIRKSTTKLTKSEMSAFMNSIYINATQFHGIVLPVPEDLHISHKQESK